MSINFPSKIEKIISKKIKERNSLGYLRAKSWRK
jgi:hypothetical protein